MRGNPIHWSFWDCIKSLWVFHNSCCNQFDSNWYSPFLPMFVLLFVIIWGGLGHRWELLLKDNMVVINNQHHQQIRCNPLLSLVLYLETTDSVLGISCWLSGSTPLNRVCMQPVLGGQGPGHAVAGLAGRGPTWWAPDLQCRSQSIGKYFVDSMDADLDDHSVKLHSSHHVWASVLCIFLFGLLPP